MTISLLFVFSQHVPRNRLSLLSLILQAVLSFYTTSHSILILSNRVTPYIHISTHIFQQLNFFLLFNVRHSSAYIVNDLIIVLFNFLFIFSSKLLSHNTPSPFLPTTSNSVSYILQNFSNFFVQLILYARIFLLNHKLTTSESSITITPILLSILSLLYLLSSYSLPPEVSKHSVLILPIFSKFFSNV